MFSMWLFVFDCGCWCHWPQLLAWPQWLFKVLLSPFLSMCDTTSSFREPACKLLHLFLMCELMTDFVICYSNNPKFKVCSSNIPFSVFYSQPAVKLEVRYFKWQIFGLFFLHPVTLAKSPEAWRRNLSELLSHTIEAFSGSSKLSVWLYLAGKGAVKTSLVFLSACSTCQNDLVKMIHNQYVSHKWLEIGW